MDNADRAESTPGAGDRPEGADSGPEQTRTEETRTGADGADRTQIRAGDGPGRTPDPVVVGVDPTDAAREAAGWAADLAAALGAPLHLVHATSGDPGADRPAWLTELADAAERTSGHPCRVEVRAGEPAEVILDAAEGAGLVVLGSYGSGSGAGVLSGSLSRALTGRPGGPVAVVRGRRRELPPSRGGPVIVGVDGSPAGRAALDLGAAFAEALGASLRAVHAWSDVAVDPDGGSHRRAGEWPELAAEGEALLDAELAPVLAAHPGLRVERDVVAGTPVRALLDRAPGARAMIVGHRAGAPAPGMAAGSTSGALVGFAACPVVVATATGPDTGATPRSAEATR